MHIAQFPAATLHSLPTVLSPSASAALKSTCDRATLKLIFLELFCAPNSTLSGMPPPGCLAVRITEADDLTKKETAAALHSIIQLASQLRLRVHAWVSISCTAGCRWRHINARNGFKTGDVHTTHKLVTAAMNICMHLAQRSHTYSWEWPELNDLWRMTRVADLLESTGAMTCVVSSAASGLVFDEVRNGLLQRRYLRKSWRIETTLAALPSLLKPFEVTPAHIPAHQFVQCRGKIGTRSAFYPPRLAQAVWQALAPPSE